MNKVFKRNKCRYKDSSVGKRAYRNNIERFIEDMEFSCSNYIPRESFDYHITPLEKELLEDFAVLCEKHSDEEVYS